MKDNKLLKTVADIAYYAGNKNYYSGDSRMDVTDFIHLAKQFEGRHKKTDWSENNYMLELENFLEGELSKKEMS